MNTHPIDTQNMKKAIYDFPDHLNQAMGIGKFFEPKNTFKNIQNILVTGMGGSAIGGDICHTLLSDELEVALIVNRNYSLPHWVNEHTLVICSSYSGNTEETIASFEEALRNNLTCVGISNGGEIEEMCKTNGVPHIKLPYPYENFQPRMATGYFVFAIFQVLINSGLIEFDTSKLGATSKSLEKITKDIEEKSKEIAARLKGKTPIVYTSTSFKALAHIWKIKINENAKTPAFWSFFPELNHNEMVGFTNPQADFYFIMLCDKNDNPQNIKRFGVTADLMKKKGMDSEIINIEGDNIFEKVFSTLYLGDWVSYYLALEYGQDPTPVDMVEEFKGLIK